MAKGKGKPDEGEAKAEETETEAAEELGEVDFGGDTGGPITPLEDEGQTGQEVSQLRQQRELNHIKREE